MVWTVVAAIVTVIAVLAWLAWFFVPMPEMIGIWLFGRAIWQFAAVMEKKGFDDPVYRKNLQRLIDRNREFEEARNGPRS